MCSCTMLYDKHSHAGGKATFIMSGFVDLICIERWR